MNVFLNVFLAFEMLIIAGHVLRLSEMDPRWRPRGGKKHKITKSFFNAFTNKDILNMHECVFECVSDF